MLPPCQASHLLEVLCKGAIIEERYCSTLQLKPLHWLISSSLILASKFAGSGRTLSQFVPSDLRPSFSRALSGHRCCLCHLDHPQGNLLTILRSVNPEPSPGLRACPKQGPPRGAGAQDEVQRGVAFVVKELAGRMSSPTEISLLKAPKFVGCLKETEHQHILRLYFREARESIRDIMSSGS